MFNDFGSFISTASGVLVIASLAGLGLMRARVVDLKERLGESRDEITDLRRRLADLTAERAEDTARIEAQAAALDSLGREVRGEAYWAEHGRKLDEHHIEAKAHWEADEELLSRILRAMNERSP